MHPVPQQYEDRPKDGRALWRFRFERYNCNHVNFLGEKSVVKDEKEFLVRCRPAPDCVSLEEADALCAVEQLVPYTVLMVQHVKWSTNLDQEPHHITISVETDNKAWSDELPLAPWS